MKNLIKIHLLILALLTFSLPAFAGDGDLLLLQRSGTSGNVIQVTAPFTLLTGTATAGSLPAAKPLTYYYSLTSGTGALYLKLTGTSTTGWWLCTSGTAAAQ